MWSYDKKLQYPVKIKTPSPANAKVIMTQLGGPDGETGAAMRYLHQRYSCPYGEITGILTDVGISVLVWNLCVGFTVKWNESALYPYRINTDSLSLHLLFISQWLCK